MKLNDRQQRILLGVLQDQEFLSGLPTGRDFGLSGNDLGRRRIVVRDALAGLVPMNLDGWIGHAPTNSECVLYHREYERLERMGLLERHNVRGGRRTSHLRLTAAGKRAANGVLAEGNIDTFMPLDLDDLDLMSIDLPPEPQAESPSETIATAAP